MTSRRALLVTVPNHHVMHIHNSFETVVPIVSGELLKERWGFLHVSLVITFSSVLWYDLFLERKPTHCYDQCIAKTTTLLKIRPQGPGNRKPSTPDEYTTKLKEIYIDYLLYPAKRELFSQKMKELLGVALLSFGPNPAKSLVRFFIL